MADSTSRGQMAHYGGAAAELQIAQDYERRGHVVACRRWRGAGGEIDLIVRDGGEVVFVEVKKSHTRDAAAERLDRRQMARIYASAQDFLEGEPMGQLTPMRFDVALVDASGAFEIIENAFGHG